MPTKNRSKAEQQDGDATAILTAIPATFQEAVETLETEMSLWERDLVQEMPHPQACDGLGQLTRPQWCLWDLHSPLVQHCMGEFSLAHSQDISCLLMEAVWSRIHGVPASTRPLAAALRARWEVQGFDPVTMQPRSKGKALLPTVVLRPYHKQ